MAFGRVVGWAVLAGVCAFIAPRPVAAQLEAQPDFERKRDTRTLEGPTAQGRLVPPHLVYSIPPQLSPQAVASGVSGAVVLRLTVDEEGFVQRVEVDKSLTPLLDDAAMAAACHMVFDPAQRQGKPVAVQMLYQQSFVIGPATPPSSAGQALEASQPAVPGAPFSGQVRTQGTKEVLREAEVSVHLDDDTVLVKTTDAGGRFAFANVPLGRAMVRISHPGHEPYTTTETLRKDEALEVRYFVPLLSYNRFETVVIGKGATKEITRVTVSRDEVNRVAGTFGDPLRAIENLPSMAQGALAGGQLLVRGTPPRSTAVYLDGVQIPQLYHFGLLRSVIHPEFLHAIEVYPGGFGPQYGRATAGVVDVKSRHMVLERCRAQADLSFLESGFFFGCPIRVGSGPVTDGPDPRRLTVAFAGRRSYFDAFVPLVLDVVAPGQGAYVGFAPIYSDYQFKAEYRPVTAHTFSLMAFGSDDLISFNLNVPLQASARARFQLQFHRAVAHWQWRIGARMTNDFQAYVGLNSAFLGVTLDRLQPPETNTLNVAGLNNTGPAFGFRNELRYQMFEMVSLLAGVDYAVETPEMVAHVYERTPHETEGGGGPVLTITRNVLTEKRVNLNLAPYFQAIIRPLPNITFIPGLRLDYMRYSANTRVLAPSPRLAFTAEPLPGTVLKATAGLYFQAPKIYETSPTLGNPRLRPERSVQTTVGIEQRLTPFLSVAINGFLNFRRDLVQGFALPVNVDVDLGIPLFQTSFDNASVGRVYGVDVLLRHDITKHFYGFVAYTLSKSELQKPPDNRWRPFNFDQTHILTAVGQYRVPWRLPFRHWSRAGRLPRGLLWNAAWAVLCGDVSLGARFRYFTGNPQDYITAAVDLPQPDPENPDAPVQRKPAFVKRFSPYHQLDLRVDYKMPFDMLLVTLSLDILNAYNSTADPNDIPRIPFLPVFSMQFEF